MQQSHPKLASVGDINGDGKLDVIVSNDYSSNLSLLIGKGDGSLQSPVLLPLGAHPGTIAFGDFNTDGKPDLAVTRGESGSVAILLNQGNCLATNSVVTTSSANYSGVNLSGESIASAFGVGLAATAESAASIPLPASLAGTTVKITDSSGTDFQAGLFYVSPLQVNYTTHGHNLGISTAKDQRGKGAKKRNKIRRFVPLPLCPFAVKLWLNLCPFAVYQLPKGLAVGTATVTITNAQGQTSTGTVTIANVSPGLFTATADGKGAAAASVLYIKGSDCWGAQVATCSAGNVCSTVPIDLNAADEVYLELYGTGIRARSDLANVRATIDSDAVPVVYAGAQCCFVGVDQVNVLIPKSLAGRGEVELLLTVDGKPTNSVRINLK